MKILGVSVKQVVIGIEFTPEDLIRLEWFLKNSSVEYDGESTFEKEAQEFVVKELYPTLTQLLEELKNAPR